MPMNTEKFIRDAEDLWSTTMLLVIMANQRDLRRCDGLASEYERFDNAFYQLLFFGYVDEKGTSKPGYMILLKSLLAQMALLPVIKVQGKDENLARKSLECLLIFIEELRTDSNASIDEKLETSYIKDHLGFLGVWVKLALNHIRAPSMVVLAEVVDESAGLADSLGQLDKSLAEWQASLTGKMRKTETSVSMGGGAAAAAAAASRGHDLLVLSNLPSMIEEIAPSRAQQAHPITIVAEDLFEEFEFTPVAGAAAAAAAQSFAALIEAHREEMNASDSGTRETTLATVAQTLRCQLGERDSSEVAVAYVNSFNETAAGIRVDIPFLGTQQNAALARLVELSEAMMRTGLCDGAEPYLTPGFAMDAMFHCSVLPEARTTLERQDRIQTAMRHYLLLFETFYRAFPDKERILILKPLAFSFEGYSLKQNAALSNYLALMASLLWRRMMDTRPLAPRQLVIKLSLFEGMSDREIKEMKAWAEDDWNSMLGIEIVRVIASIGAMNSEFLDSSVEIANFFSENIEKWQTTIAETVPTAPGPAAAVKASLSFGVPSLESYKAYVSTTPYSATVSRRLDEVAGLWGAEAHFEEGDLHAKVISVFQSYYSGWFSRKHHSKRVEAFIEYLVELNTIEAAAGRSMTAESLQKELRDLLNQVLSDLNSESYNNPGQGGMLEFIFGSFFTRYMFVQGQLAIFIDQKMRSQAAAVAAAGPLPPPPFAVIDGGGGGAAAAAARAAALSVSPFPSPSPPPLFPMIGEAVATSGAAGPGAVPAPEVPPPLPAILMGAGSGAGVDSLAQRSPHTPSPASFGRGRFFPEASAPVGDAAKVLAYPAEAEAEAEAEVEVEVEVEVGAGAPASSPIS